MAPEDGVAVALAFATLVAALVVIPLVASWRSTAQSVIDAAYPPNATTAADETATAARAALESMLNLNSGILRDPLTVLTIATPLVTATLAGFVPQFATWPMVASGVLAGRPWQRVSSCGSCHAPDLGT